MASVYDPKKNQSLVPTQKATATAASAATPTVASSTDKAAKKYTGLSGLSTTTQSNLGNYQNGYTQSAAVTAAENYLNQNLAGKPGAYQGSQYDSQASDLLAQYNNRQPFKYDLNGDMLYQQYKDQYMRNGQQAMMNTMGNAAALTGGYGSSYASTAGNQAYQQYLTQLNDVIPTLYDKAASRYDQEGADLQNRWNMANTMANQDRAQYDNDVTNWTNTTSALNSSYNTLYGNDYGAYTNGLNYWTGLAQQENSNYWTAQSQAMAMLEAGRMPPASMLTAAGMTQAEADAYLVPVTNTVVKYVGGGKKKDGILRENAIGNWLQSIGVNVAGNLTNYRLGKKG